jgi:hypothetical protein
VKTDPLGGWHEESNVAVVNLGSVKQRYPSKSSTGLNVYKAIGLCPAQKKICGPSFCTGYEVIANYGNAFVDFCDGIWVVRFPTFGQAQIIFLGCFPSDNANISVEPI